MTMLHTPVCDEFGITYPIFGFAHDIATVAAITNAGGLGVYGATRRFPHEITEELAEHRSFVQSIADKYECPTHRAPACVLASSARPKLKACNSKR